jgi:hypothetical protein
MTIKNYAWPPEHIITNVMVGCSMASYQLLITKVLVQPWDNSCGICGGQNGMGWLYSEYCGFLLSVILPVCLVQ